MKFPYSMLRDFVNTSLSAEAVGDLLTMAGFELEGIEESEGEPVLDIKVMSNRGDGLSVFGLAREVLAKDPRATPTDLYRAAADRFREVSPAEAEQIGSDIATIEAPECFRFACRTFVGVPAAAGSASWMQERLRQAGMRPISLLVDLTNYVMLELGQPLHAFDRDKLSGRRIVVRHARPGEKLTTLNGQEHELQGQMMICDADKPVGVPGVMGGLETEVSDQTRTVLLESANFLNLNVRKTRKDLGLNTEASYRFERSVDPDGVVSAVRRFSQLLLQMAPDVRLSNIVDHYPGKKEAAAVIVRPTRASTLLGMTISREQAREYLSRLGMEVSTQEEDLLVTPPSWRPDIVREDDLIEEIGRVHGYERIPELLPEGSTTMGGPQGYELWQDVVLEATIRAGFVQTISHSLRDRHPLDGPSVEQIGPRNPASPEMAWLRTSVLPCLADAARRNNPKDARFAELGRVFGRVNGDLWEGTQLGLLLTDGFFELKGAVEEILDVAGIEARWQTPEQPDPRFHPTRQAQLEGIGILGQIHPDVADETDLAPSTALAELDLKATFGKRREAPPLRPVSRFPAVRRDISIQISKEVTYGQVAGAISDAVGPVLERQWLFDVYEGKGIPEGSHSLAIALQLRKLDGTFTDEEANQVRDRAVEALAGLGATRR